MKSTGIIRHVDNLDRIVIPKELCRTLEILPKSPLEIFVEDTRIVLKKHELGEGGRSKGSTGVVRHVDGLDRIVIPKEICKGLGIAPKDAMEIFVDDTRLILEKHGHCCIFCKETQKVVLYKKKFLCEKCIKEIASLI